MALRNLRSEVLSNERAGPFAGADFTIAQICSTVHRSIVRCSGTQQILAIFTFLWLLTLRQGKESDT